MQAARAAMVGLHAGRQRKQCRLCPESHVPAVQAAKASMASPQRQARVTVVLLNLASIIERADEQVRHTLPWQKSWTCEQLHRWDTHTHRCGEIAGSKCRL